MRPRPLIIAILVCFALLHFIHIEADFPQGANWSGDLYTDEGIYTSAALAYSATGDWYRPGDWNAAVTLPVGHLVHALVFAIFGASLFSARLTILLCFVQILYLFYLVTKRYANEAAAFVVVALLVTNFYLFAYSRFAILDMIMCYFIMLALSIALLARKVNYGTLALAGLCLALATLTKYSAIIGLAPLAYIVWARAETNSLSNRLFRVAVPVALCGVIVLLYLTWASAYYPDDFTAYRNTLAARPETNIRALLFNLFRTLRVASTNDLLLAICVFFLIPISLITIPSYRNSLLVRGLCLWAFAYYLLLCTTTYIPPRYFIMFTIPLLALVGLALMHAYQHNQWPMQRLLAPAIIAILIGVNLYRIASYLSHPEYTFVNMAREVTAITTQESSTKTPLILGNFSAGLSLITGIPYVNSEFGTIPLADRLKYYPATHYVALGNEEETKSQLEEWYTLKQIKSWDVFHNYLRGQQVYLYELIPK
jgi:4-amino-4-deoxy-L-arabinose transferase-like glycosyltransferase